MFLHAAHAASQGHRKIMLRTVDTDVVVLAVANMQQLPIDELWVAFGVGSAYRHIAIHTIATAIGCEKASALPYFHALTGCDVTSSFYGKGKKSAWDAWNNCSFVTEPFASLSNCPKELSKSMRALLEHFVVQMYSKTLNATSVNEARLILFSNGNRSIECVPPTQGALEQHALRAAYQAGHVWAQALTAEQVLPSPGDWGWLKRGNSWVANWTNLPEARKACREVRRCGCIKGCKKGRCKCKGPGRNGCTALCACYGRGTCNV
jgi:hypothetical protein